jgi:hypothetical protein
MENAKDVNFSDFILYRELKKELQASLGGGDSIPLNE